MLAHHLRAESKHRERPGRADRLAQQTINSSLMTILSANRRNQHGSVLMVTLFMLGLMGFFLYAYLYTVRTQRSLVSRSQAWNNALGLAEAGIEEALGRSIPVRPLPQSIVP